MFPKIFEPLFVEDPMLVEPSPLPPSPFELSPLPLSPEPSPLEPREVEFVLGDPRVVPELDKGVEDPNTEEVWKEEEVVGGELLRKFVEDGRLVSVSFF